MEKELKKEIGLTLCSISFLIGLCMIVLCLIGFFIDPSTRGNVIMLYGIGYGGYIMIFMKNESYRIKLEFKEEK